MPRVATYPQPCGIETTTSFYVCAEWVVRMFGKTRPFQRLVPPKPVGQKFAFFLNSVKPYVADHLQDFIPLVSGFLCKHIYTTTRLKTQYEQSGPQISFLEVDLSCTASWSPLSLKQPQLTSTARSLATPSR